MTFILNASLLCLCVAIFYTGGSCNQSNSSENDISSSFSEETGISKRIYGGLSRRNGDYDFVAQLTVVFRGSPNTKCSGVVLTDRIVLTVAHCVARGGGSTADFVWVRLPAGGIYLFNKKEIFIHPSFNGLYAKDVAVLRKDWRGATYMRGFGRVPKLPTDVYANYDNMNAVIGGWGRTSVNKLSYKFQYAGVTIMDQPECEQKYDKLLQSMDPDDKFICTANGVSGICEGDWGGPIIIKSTNTFDLVGLSMYTEKPTCGSDNLQDSPSAYFELSSVTPWINSIINQ